MAACDLKNRPEGTACRSNSSTEGYRFVRGKRMKNIAFFRSLPSVSSLGEVTVRCDRRDFLRGTWGSRPGNPIETATILIQVRPERFAAAADAVGAIDGIAIRSRDPRGRLMVAIDATAIGPTLSALGDLPDVLSTNLLNMSAGLGGPEARP